MYKYLDEHQPIFVLEEILGASLHTLMYTALQAQGPIGDRRHVVSKPHKQKIDPPLEQF